MPTHPRRLPADFDSLLDPKQVCAALAVSLSTLERMIQRGEFPKHDRRCGTMRRWKSSTVQAFMDDVAA